MWTGLQADSGDYISSCEITVAQKGKSLDGFTGDAGN